MRLYVTCFVPFLIIGLTGKAQKRLEASYSAGFMTLQLTDSSRIYKPGSPVTDKLHYRPLDLDIWYPSTQVVDEKEPLKFRDLFKLFEERANTYQNETDYSGMTNELAQFYVAELGMGMDGQKLLDVVTDSYENLELSTENFPLILYMAGFNGMGFENYKILEHLAQNGFIVVSISSVGRYPGDMTNQKEDMLEQVADAEFAIKQLGKEGDFTIDHSNIGVLGTSWGGMAAAVLVNKNPNIISMVSFDGTETHYFGEEDTNLYADGATGGDNDRHIQEIYDSNVLNAADQKMSYLYFESGDKLDDFIPTHEVHYFKTLNSDKYYLRFKNSEHTNFSCIPSVLKADATATTLYGHLEKATLSFFERKLKGAYGFKKIWSKLNELEYTANIPFDIENLEKPKTKFSKLLGKVFDSVSRQPLPYVNAGVLNKDIGTVSDTLGNFNLKLEDHLNKDTLRVSRIGYRSQDFLLNTILHIGDTLRVALSEEISELDEVVVSAKAFKRRTLGNKTESKFLGTGFGYDQLGAEMGIKINVRKNPTFVDAFNFTISQRKCHQMVNSPCAQTVTLFVQGFSTESHGD
ncbi:MAG: carboxypeptidase-like regulatory domain-containing protein, partial [Bacteroidota bacterium]